MLDPDRKPPYIPDEIDDPRKELSDAARLRLDDANGAQWAHRQAAQARLMARYKSGDQQFTFAEWLRHDEHAAEGWSKENMEAAFMYTSAEVSEYMAIGKRGTELEAIISETLKGIANSVGLSKIERDAVWQKLYTVRPDESSQPPAVAIKMNNGTPATVVSDPFVTKEQRESAIKAAEGCPKDVAAQSHVAYTDLRAWARDRGAKFAKGRNSVKAQKIEAYLRPFVPTPSV